MMRGAHRVMSDLDFPAHTLLARVWLSCSGQFIRDWAKRDPMSPFETEIEKIESALGPLVTVASDYPARHIVPPHRHRRPQLLFTLTGIPVVTTQNARWLVPPDHAFWIPAGVEHSIAMSSEVSARSLYVDQDRLDAIPSRAHVVRVTPLMRSLILEATATIARVPPDTRSGLIHALILHEIPALAEIPLGLPMPAEPKFAALCMGFLEAPTARASIDHWAEATAMSRRTFTRAFRRETGLSLLEWRQQASVFAALPRLAAGEPVTAVALDLGYESPAAFTTMFRRMLGASPRRYMKQAA
jgi:AraC-like DNA-binding protein/mannose-6-phosphate isomerase-like protein (cupin superfamily)